MSPTFIVPLDASGTGGLVIDNLSVTWLTAAASTQPLDGFFFLMKITLTAPLFLLLVVGSAAGQHNYPKLRPSKDYWDWAGTRHPTVHYINVSNRRRLAAVGDMLYMLNHRNQILWRWDSGGPPLNGLPFIDSRGTIYATGMDLLWVAIDSANGQEKWRGTANGRASYSPAIPYKDDMYFVVTYMESYRRSPQDVIKNDLTLCRGNSILWTTEIPSGAQLSVSGSRVVLLIKRKNRTIVQRITVPDRLDKPIGKVSALADYN